MTKKIFRPLLLALFSLVLALGASSSAFGAATITIVNNDPAGVGFNDPTVVAPVGGNTGTTLGQQRLIAFQAAASKWGATLDSTVTITIRAQWTALTCTATTAVLGSAGAIQVFRDFPGAPFASTFYPEALTGKLLGADPDPATPEINANFNVNLGNTGCLTGTFFYLGLDNNHGSNIDLVTVLTHEFGHGLGFQTFTNGTTGAPLAGFLSIYDRFLMDLSTGKSWLQMTNAERATSALNTHKLAWDGPQVTTDVPSVLSLGTPFLKINSPPGIAGNYDVGTASFGAALTAGGLTGNVIQALDPADGAGPLTTDGCTALTNAAAVAGNIAIIDRGTCGFTVKVKNAQDAGAIAVIIADNVAGSPPAGLGGTDPTITIPSVRVTLADGNTIKAQLGTGVNATLKLDTSVRAGADAFGKALLFAPNPFQSGSSVSHFDDIAFRNQLMEPAINGDLTQSVLPPQDMTFSELRDIGWVASALPNAIAKTTGDPQNTALNQPFVIPFSVTVSPAVSGIIVTWTVNPNGGGAGANFPSTSSRFATSTTDALGVAIAPALTANGQPGLYGMNATVPGAGTTTFALSNDPVPVAGAACATDTTQADFQAGVATNTDVTTSPGDVILLNPASPGPAECDAQLERCRNYYHHVGRTNVHAVGYQSVGVGRHQSILQRLCWNYPESDVVRQGDEWRLADRSRPGISDDPRIQQRRGGLLHRDVCQPPDPYRRHDVRPCYPADRQSFRRHIRVDTQWHRDPRSRCIRRWYRVSGATSGTVWSIPLTAGVSTDAGFDTFMLTSYVPSGDFVSGLKNSNPPVTTLWTTLSWNAAVPANTTLKFQAAASNSFAGPFNFVGPDGTAGTFFTSGGTLSQFNGNRYLKSKSFFATTDGTVTPTLNDLTVCFDNVAAVPDLSITKTDGVTTVVPGTSVVYTITASNPGPANASGATVADNFPASETCTWTCAGSLGGTCTASGSGNINDTVNLPAGASVTYTATCSTALAATGSLGNTATITFGGDPIPANNSATDTDTLTPQADLSITKTDGVTTATPGGSVTYTITASNAGPNDAPGSTVADTLPASLTATWTCVRRGRRDVHGVWQRQHQRHRQPAGRRQCDLHRQRDHQSIRHGHVEQHRDGNGPCWRHRSDTGQQLGDRQRHAGAPGRSEHHQDGRRDNGDAGRKRDVHHRRQQRRAEQCAWIYRDRYLAGEPDRDVDVRRRGRRNVHGVWHGQH